MTQRAVRMTHPDLDAEITVAESAVPTHLASGWAPVDESADLSPETAGGPVVLAEPDPADEPVAEQPGAPLRPSAAALPDLSKKKGD